MALAMARASTTNDPERDLEAPRRFLLLLKYSYQAIDHYADPVELPIWLREPRAILEDYSNDISEIHSNTQSRLQGKSISASSISPSQDYDAIEITRRILRDMDGPDIVRHIKSWCNRRRLDPATDVRFSKALFRGLVNAEHKLSHQLEFLEHPGLNHIESGNYEFLLEYHLYKSKATVQRSNQLLSWITKRISRGVMAEEQIEPSIEALCRFASKNQDQLMKARVINELLDGFRLSSTLQGKDLSPKILGILIEAISRRNSELNLYSLGVDIISSIKEHQLMEVVPALKLFFLSWFSAIRNSRETKDQLHGHESMQQLVMILGELPTTIASYLIQLISKRQLQDWPATAEEEIKRIELLKTWWTCLGSSSTIRPYMHELVGKALKQLESPTQISSLHLAYLGTLDDVEKCDFLLQHVYTPQRRATISMMVTQDEYRGLSEQVNQIDYPGIEKLGRGLRDQPFVQLLRSISNDASFPEQCQQHLVHTMRRLGYQKQVVFAAKNQQRLGISLQPDLVATEIFSTYENDALYAFRLLRACPSVSLTLVPNLVVTMIETPNMPYWTLIKHLKQQLDFVGRKRIDNGEGLRSRQPLVSLSPTRFDSIDRRLFHDLLKRMAVAFSNAEHLPYTISFRAVTEVYRLMGVARVTPGHCITKALVRTGVIRPLSQGIWVPYERIEYITSLVRKNEGDEVADRICATIFAWRADLVKDARAAVSFCKRVGETPGETSLALAQKLPDVPTDQLGNVWRPPNNADSWG